MLEEWRPAFGYPLYEVSNAGRVRSLDGFRTEGQKQVFRRGRILTSTISKNGYPFIAIGKKRIYVHKLVLEAFVGLRPKNYESRHLDGNRANPRLENLAYGTRLENRLDAYRHGTRSSEKDRQIAARTVASKNAKYGEGWGTLGFAGVAYSRRFDL